MRRLRNKDWLKTGLKAVAITAFAGYCGWNVFWLSAGCLPPSIWSWATGLPCPSTGMTRSLAALAGGDVSGCFLYNPLTAAFVALLLASVLLLLKSWRDEHCLRVPAAVGRLWLATLGVAWAAKFVIGSQYW